MKGFQMTIRIIRLFVITFILYSSPIGQTLSVDLDTAAGIQNTFISREPVVTLPVAIRISGCSSISSYEFKVAFDTAKFSFVGAQQDFGITGEQNILVKNGSAIIGISRPQINPAAQDTIEFGFAITGSSSTSLVSGDGLAGVLYLKSKLKIGDSTTISISNGALSDFDLNSTPFTSYKTGKFKLLPVTSLFDSPSEISSFCSDPTLKIALIVRNQTITFNVPAKINENKNRILMQIFSVNGRLVTQSILSELKETTVYKGFDTVIPENSGKFIICLNTGANTFSQMVTIP
jgi:hypothetical protein